MLRVACLTGAMLFAFGACQGHILDRPGDGGHDAASDRATDANSNGDVHDAAVDGFDRDGSVDAVTFDVPQDNIDPPPDVPAIDVPAIDALEVDTPIVDPDAAPDAPIVTVDAGPSSTRQTPRDIGWMGAPNGFYEYLPPTYETDPGNHALLVFWHGIGENGNGSTDLSRVLANGPPRLIAADAWPNDRPFIVLSPQHSGSGCPSANEIHDFIAWAMANYRVDTRQVFLTGLSCGSIGSWSYITAYGATQIAAAVLISGDPGDPSASWSAWGHSMCGLGDLAIWAVHGDSDPTVNYSNENITMNDLLACPSPPRRETHWNVIAGGGHDVWTSTYDLTYGFQIYDFLLRNPHP